MKKVCTKCLKSLNHSSFNRDSSNLDGYEHSCRECRNAYRRNLWAASPARRARSILKSKEYRTTEKGKLSRWRSKLREYGIDENEFNRLFSLQGGLCAICKSDENLCVDHCHKSNKVRGLLCKTCNTAIGMAHEDIEVLKSMIIYLEGFRVDIK